MEVDEDEQPGTPNNQRHTSISLKHSETDSDSDDFKLSDDVLAMIREVNARKDADEGAASSSSINEDWSLSQFWYTEESMAILANEVLDAVADLKPNAQIACLSCPSLYRALLRINGVFTSFHPYLYEFDTRFRTGNEEHFVHYDYNKPMNFPTNHTKKFDLVVADPPHLSDACFVSYGLTINSILKDRKDKIIFCTGVKMSDLIHRLFRCQETNFKPEHERKLGNDFSCFTNYKPLTFEWVFHDTQ